MTTMKILHEEIIINNKNMNIEHGNCKNTKY